MPKPSDETRAQAVKEARKAAEEAKVGLRRARRAELDETKEGLGEDDVKRLEKAVQKVRGVIAPGDIVSDFLIPMCLA